MQNTNLIFQGGLLFAVLTFVLQNSALTAAEISDSTWKPEASEKLVKLPAHYLKKRLDYDFAESSLGKTLVESKSKIVAKSQTLVDLQQAIEQADGELRLELRHQFLAAKRTYLGMVKEQNQLRRKKLNTDLKVYEKMLGKLNEKNAVLTLDRQNLLKAQKAARKRFQSSLNKVNLKVFQSSAVPESAYSVKYAENLATIEKLVVGIQNHKMNTSPTVNGEPITKSEYIRKMVGDTQAELAIMDQERTIIGYMAKIVALDAMALSEEAMDADIADAEVAPQANLASTVGFFVAN